MTTTPVPTPAQTDLIRQGERTVDNLKRLFAFIFSLSFALIGLGALDKLKLVMIGQKPAPPFSAWLLNIEMLGVFVVTAGVFFHQSAKYLDNRYARYPLAEARPFRFAADYLVQVLTAAPFYFMAFAFNPLVTNAVGYIWFVGFYVFLLTLGLILLFLANLRHVPPVTYLNTYWFIMNSGMLLLILALFQLFVVVGVKCPTSPSGGKPPFFLFIFGLLAFARDIMDYRIAWRFVYPIDPATAQELDLWPMTKLRDSERWRAIASNVGILFVVIILILICGTLQFWNFTYWTNVCRVS